MFRDSHGNGQYFTGFPRQCTVVVDSYGASSNLISVISDMFFGCFLFHHLVKLIYFIFFSCVTTDMVK